MIESGYFLTKLLLHRVAYDLEKFYMHVESSWGKWQGHTHFWYKLNLGIFSQLCLHRVAYDQERLF